MKLVDKVVQLNRFRKRMAKAVSKNQGAMIVRVKDLDMIHDLVLDMMNAEVVRFNEEFNVLDEILRDYRWAARDQPNA